MKSLAKGTNSDCIFKLLKVMINTQQQIYQEATQNTEAIEDIADKLESDKNLFDEDTKQYKYNDLGADEENKYDATTHTGTRSDNFNHLFDYFMISK